MSDKETAPWIKAAAKEIFDMIGSTSLAWYQTQAAEIIAKHAAECRAPAPQPADLLQTIRYLLLSWSVFYAKLPDGEYDGLGEMRTALANIKDVEVILAATPQVTPTRANRMALRCPHCNKEGANSTDAGGNELCFHCGSCGFAECEWSSPAHEVLEGTSEQVREFKPYMEDHEYYDPPQAPPTPEQSRDTGVSLDGGKTIHPKFKND